VLILSTPVLFLRSDMDFLTTAIIYGFTNFCLMLLGADSPEQDMDDSDEFYTGLTIGAELDNISGDKAQEFFQSKLTECHHCEPDFDADIIG
jgi:hypothetical protein